MVASTVFMAIVVESAEFTPGWNDVLNTTLVMVAFVGPIAAGIAAFHMQRMKASGVVSVAGAAPSGLQRLQLLAFLAVDSWATLSLVVATAMLSFSGTNLAAVSSPSLLLLLLALMVVHACAALGLMLGWHLSHRLLAPAIVVAAFVWMYAVSYADGWAARLSPIDPATFYRVFLEPRVELLLAQIAIFAGIIVVSVGLMLMSAGVRFVLLCGGVLLVASAISFLPRFGESSTQLRSAPNPVLCDRQAAVVCVWPPRGAYLGDIDNAVELTVASVGPLLSPPPMFAEPGLFDSRESGLGVLLLPDRPAVPAMYIEAAAQAMLPEPNCSVEYREPWNHYLDLRRWLVARLANSSRPVPVAGVLPRFGRLVGAPDEVQAKWVDRRLAGIGSC